MRHKLSALSGVSSENISTKKKKIKWSVRYNYYVWQKIGVRVDSFIID